MPFLDAVRLAPKRAPVKCSPVTVLQVYKDCQNTEDHHAGQNALLVHEGGNSAPRSRDARWETATPRYPTQPARSNLSTEGLVAMPAVSRRMIVATIEAASQISFKTTLTGATRSSQQRQLSAARFSNSLLPRSASLGRLFAERHCSWFPPISPA